MINIRPVSDLRNRYPEVEAQAREQGPVFLTKNGHGSMVVMTLEQYGRLAGDVEAALDAAELQASSTGPRYTHGEAFGSIREGLRDAV